MNEFSQNEFRTVFHREFNREMPRIAQAAEETYNLQQKVPDRKLITTLEGDIIEYNGKPYLAHMLYVKRLNESKFKDTFNRNMAENKAANLYDVIANLANKYNSSFGPLELDVEIKDNVSYKVLEEVNNMLKLLQKEKNISFYIASFYKDALENINKIDSNIRTARHAFMSIGDEGYNIPLPDMTTPSFKPTITIASSGRAYGNPTNIMYTPEHTPEQLLLFTQDRNVKGAFTNLNLF